MPPTSMSMPAAVITMPLMVIATMIAAAVAMAAMIAETAGNMAVMQVAAGKRQRQTAGDQSHAKKRMS